MPTTRQALTSSVVNNVIYVLRSEAIGGANLNTNEAYFPSNNSWVTLSPIPTARNDLTSSVVNNVIYVFGGLGVVGCLNTTEAYFPSNNSWIILNSMPASRSSSASIV